MSSTAVYGVSVDSRSRNPDEPDNAYTVQLQRNMDRVKSVQLGSFQFQDSRTAFTSASTLSYSEPVVIPANTFLRFEETTRVQDKATKMVSSSTRNLTLYLPPTMNKITGMDNGTLQLTTENIHGLLFGVSFYPLVGLRMRLVGGDFPQDLHAFTTPSFPTDSTFPVLTTATTESPYFTGNNTTFTWATDYLAEITGGVGSAELRMLDDAADPDDYHSYIHAPRPTLAELFIMLNAATTSLTNRTDLSGAVVSSSFATPITITTAAAHGLSTGDEVVISGVSDPAANGTFFITAVTSTTFVLDSSVGTAAGGAGTWFSPQTLHVGVTFGFDNANNVIVASGPSRVTESSTNITTQSVRLVGTVGSLLGFNNGKLDPPISGTLPTSILRTINFKPGTFTASELAVETSSRLNPADFSVDTPIPLFDKESINLPLDPVLTAADRTFHYTVPVGNQLGLAIDHGQYSGAQLADWMTAKLSPIPAQLSVTFDAATNRFTISHNLGLSFSLDFSTTPIVAAKLGFDAEAYADASSFTSVRAAIMGVSATATPPDNVYNLVADANAQKFTIHTKPPTNFYSVSGTSTVGVGGVWTPLVLTDLNFAHHFQPGDILTAVRPTLSGARGSTKEITGAAAPGITITAAAHGLVDGDTVTVTGVEGQVNANDTWMVTSATLNTFRLQGAAANIDPYVTGTGVWWSEVSLVTGVQRPTTTYEVVVKSVWDASTGLPLLTLEPTASIFSVQDAGTANRDPLGTPSLAPTDGLILLRSSRRNVFMLHMNHPEGTPESLGFPPIAWPPSQPSIVSGGSCIPHLNEHDLYDASILGIPSNDLYVSPFTWNLLPPDYIMIVLKSNCLTQDTHTHSFRRESFPIFAKLLVTSPYINISEELHFTTFAVHAKFNSILIEFVNPDGTLVQFNGRPHSYTLLFTVSQDDAVLPCF